MFPYILDHIPFRKLQHSLAEWQRLWSQSHIQSCGCQRTAESATGAATLHLHGEPLPPCLVLSQPPAKAVSRVSLMASRHRSQATRATRQCPARCDKAISSPGMVPGGRMGPSQPLATQGKRVASSLCPWLRRASSSLQDRDGVLTCPVGL